MTPPTNPTLTDQNIADIQWLLEQPGCPQLPEWLYLSKGPDESVFLIFEEDSDHNLVEDNWIRHDPAVLNTVVVWVNGEVVPWVLTIEPTLFQDLACPNPWDDSTWIIGSTRVSYHDTYTQATLALLSEIRAELEGGVE